MFGGCGAGVFGCCTLSTWSGFYPFSFWWGSFGPLVGHSGFGLVMVVMVCYGGYGLVVVIALAIGVC